MVSTLRRGRSRRLKNRKRSSSFRDWVKSIFPRQTRRSQRLGYLGIAVFVLSLLVYRILVLEEITKANIEALPASIPDIPKATTAPASQVQQLKQPTEAPWRDPCNQPELCVNSDPYRWGICTLQPCSDECQAKIQNGTISDRGVHYGTGKKITRQMSRKRRNLLRNPHACLTSHQYRFTFIHVLKSGGSAVRTFLAEALCPDGNCSNMTNVLQLISCPYAFTELRDYLTFSFIRNPYSRYYSAFAMANSQDFRIIPDPLDMETFATASMAAKQQMTRLHLSHFSEQYRFLFDGKGCPVFDVLGRLEHVQEDFPYILSLIDSPALRDYYNQHGLDSGNATNYGSRSKGSNFSLPYTLRSPNVRSVIQKEYAEDFIRFGMDPLEVPPR